MSVECPCRGQVMGQGWNQVSNYTSISTTTIEALISHQGSGRISDWMSKWDVEVESQINY